MSTSRARAAARSGRRSGDPTRPAGSRPGSAGARSGSVVSRSATGAGSSGAARHTVSRLLGRHLPSAHSPLIALCALLGSGLLAAGAEAGRPALAAAVLLVQLVLGLCWLTVLQASLATATLVGLAALASDVLLLRSERATAGSTAGVLGLAMLAAIGAQLLRRRRRNVTSGLAAALSGVVLVIAVSVVLPLRQFPSGTEVALTALVAIAIALVGARLMPGPPLPVRGLCLLIAIVGAGRFGVAAESLSVGAAVATAAAAAAFALVVDLGIVRMGPQVAGRQQPALQPVAALLPVVAALPAVYVIGWIVGS